DLEAIARRMEREKPVVRRAAFQMYDRYLKANRVDDGVASYSRALKIILSPPLHDALGTYRINKYPASRQRRLAGRLCAWLTDGGGIVVRARQHQLDVGDVAFSERPLRVGEVEIPHPHEPLVHAEAEHRVATGGEARAPLVNRARVVDAEVLE